MANVVKTISDLRARVQTWRQNGDQIALVPTMGALHDGHLSLIQLGKAKADKAIISIFVNPTQFNQAEDLQHYPRQELQDIEMASAAGADLIYMPDITTMYPTGHATKVMVEHISSALCGHARPGHFDGVATIVAKLLLQSLPDIAIFGEKDFQQLLIIKTMVRDLNIPVSIIGAPLIRDTDGLALSSRNTRLNANEREIAKRLPVIMQDCAAAINSGTSFSEALAAGRAALDDAGFDQVDYFEIRSSDTLEAMSSPGKTARLFAAAFIGDTRLIDNILLEETKP